MLAGVGQRTAGTLHILLPTLRREALPQAAGSVGHASQKNEENGQLLHN